MESQSIKWIYELVSIYLKKIFKCRIYNQFMSFDKEDEIGIFLYDGQNDQYTIDGNVTFRDIKVQVQYTIDGNVTFRDIKVLHINHHCFSYNCTVLELLYP